MGKDRDSSDWRLAGKTLCLSFVLRSRPSGEAKPAGRLTG